MRLLRTCAALLLGLPMATPIPVAAEDAPLAPEVQRRVAVVVLARRIRGYAAMAKASSDCQVEKGRLPRRQALAISLEELGISRRVLTNPPCGRHRSGTRAPLPTGRYSLGPVEPLGPAEPRELGPISIGIEPQFPKGRGHLGIHLDPSASCNANSGTLGCVGLIRWDDMQTLAGLVQRRNVRTLVVSE